MLGHAGSRLEVRTAFLSEGHFLVRCSICHILLIDMLLDGLAAAHEDHRVRLVVEDGVLRVTLLRQILIIFPALVACIELKIWQQHSRRLFKWVLLVEHLRRVLVADKG